MCCRNALLEAESSKFGFNAPAARKTGTTICGVVYKVRKRALCVFQKRYDLSHLHQRISLSLSQDGIVLGADTRATEGMVVADKNCSKIHYISPNI